MKFTAFFNMVIHIKPVFFAFMLLCLATCFVKCSETYQGRIEEDPIIETPKEVLGSKYSADESLILVSTLEGNLVAIDKRTGAIKWKLQDEPVIKLSKELSKTFNLLPDPKDGSLYMLGSSRTEALTKLPFTIPELVAASPSQSSDGMLYMGKKMDMWFMIDPITGEKQETLSFQELEHACPRNKLTGPSIFIGRTEYSLILLDSRTRERHWNVTYFDYTSSTPGVHDPKDYDLAHFTTSSTGKILTLDRHSGDLLWQSDLGSPVVGMYGLVRDVSKLNDGAGLVPIPFTSLSADTLHNLAARLGSPETERRVTGDTKLFQALYIGQYQHGLYAFPSLVDELTTLVAPHSTPLLLDGPDGSSDSTAKPIGNSPTGFVSINLRLPDLKGRPDQPQGTPISSHVPALSLIDRNIVPEVPRKPPALRIPDEKRGDKTAKSESSPAQEAGILEDKNNLFDVSYGISFVYGISMLAASLVFYMFYKEWKGNKDKDVVHSNKSQRSNDGHEMCIPIELKTGWVQVGKISFNPNHILGKGCDGTFVYKGKYDSRNVAVKRLLPECFSTANREVSLYRESDEHRHVIRYFCTEQDRQFKYIALEYCVATLQDYVTGKYDAANIDGITILQHATDGLAHLHSLDIVHRDIKPQNVLISVKNAKGDVRAMISDFGLCKKLKIGRMSFSRKSGVAGTEGWIAPEMMNEEAVGRTTCAVDIFSLGLVYFYVLTKGQHPFGDALRRQANILSGEYDLSSILNNVPAHTLIEKMISIDPLERPPARAILQHPIFWSKERILQFFQDVSDRVEKDSSDSVVLQSLERAAHDVVRGSWRTHLDEVVMEDLRRHRTYQGRSVRDLLRALRNKKNHYREVADEVQRVLGKLPDEFCDYWTTRFPKLLMHAWYAMHCIKNEHIFAGYYDQQYDFIQKYIVWPTPKPKTDFHRALETAFPVYDPLFPKVISKEKLNATASDVTVKEEVVPDSWDERLTEETELESASAPSETSDREPNSALATGKIKDGASGEGNANRVTDQTSQSTSTHPVDNIVLGPGGQWGLPVERPPLREPLKNGDCITPKVPAWSLPTVKQQWEFSEITHHGRRKQRTLHRKKKVDN